MKFRALEAREIPPLRRTVDADEVFEVPDGEYADGLKDQPYFEDVTPKARATKEKD